MFKIQIFPALPVICNSMGVSLYDLYCCLLWHVSLSSMTLYWVQNDVHHCFLWPVWRSHMTPHSFNVYISAPVWFKFECIRTLKAIICKVYDIYWNFYGCLLWLLWQWYFYGSKRFLWQCSFYARIFLHSHPFLSITPVCFYAQNIFMLTNTDRSAFSMLMSVGFYAPKHLYARIPIFLYTSLCFYARAFFYTCVPLFLCSCKMMN